MAHGCAVWGHSVKGAVPPVITILQDSERTLEGQFGQLDEDGLNGEAGEGWWLAERGSQGVERQGGHFFSEVGIASCVQSVTQMSKPTPSRLPHKELVNWCPKGTD